MAKPIELGLVLEGDDAKEFWKNENNPKVTKEQIDMFKEAMYIYKTYVKYKLWNKRLSISQISKYQDCKISCRSKR